MGTILKSIRHGVRCYATVRVNRRVRLRMQMPSASEALKADFAAMGEDFREAMKERAPAPDGQTK